MKTKINNRELSKLVTKLFLRTRDEGDDVLYDLLAHVYPTTEVQNA
jgi:hypothetical protein